MSGSDVVSGRLVRVGARASAPAGITSSMADTGFAPSPRGSSVDSVGFPTVPYGSRRQLTYTDRRFCFCWPRGVRAAERIRTL